MSEKWGGRGRANSQMREFQLAMEFCDFSDLGYKGPKFTWSNCCEEHNFIKERLDRGVANSSWREMYPEAEIMVEAITSSDHAVLLASLSGNNFMRQKNQRFRYESSWAVENDFQDVCTRAWNGPIIHGSLWQRVGQKLHRCKSDLVRWKRATCGQTKKSIQRLQNRLNLAYDRCDDQAGSIIENIKGELEVLLAQEDEKWKQRAKVNWLKNGDRNTKFFHACANQRRRSN
jgi:hypothetical protein